MNCVITSGPVCFYRLLRLAVWRFVWGKCLQIRFFNMQTSTLIQLNQCRLRTMYSWYCYLQYHNCWIIPYENDWWLNIYNIVRKLSILSKIVLIFYMYFCPNILARLMNIYYSHYVCVCCFELRLQGSQINTDKICIYTTKPSNMS